MGEKIGLITFCDNTNYGSYLQTYGLYKYIHDLGKNIELIDYYKDVPDYERVSWNSFLKLVRHKRYYDEIETFINILIMQSHFEKLIKKNMKRSRRYTSKNLVQCKRKYSEIIVGSDLVWDLRYSQGYAYMLDFVDDNIKKLAYAASYGYERIPSEEETAFKEKLSRFECISVREKNVRDELMQLLGRKVYHVCDPTMLIEQDYWKQLVTTNKQESPYVLIYMDDSEKRISGAASRYARSKKLKIYNISKKNRDRCPLDPVEFLTLIYYAEKVFTGSYHGLLFALYFQKDISFLYRYPGNRLKTVSEILELEKYNVLSEQYDMYSKPDYLLINKKIERFRNISRQVLEKMLEDE